MCQPSGVARYIPGRHSYASCSPPKREADIQCSRLWSLIETSGIDRVCEIGARQVVLQFSTRWFYSHLLCLFYLEHRYRKNYICYSGSRDLEAVFQQRLHPVSLSPICAVSEFGDDDAATVEPHRLCNLQPPHWPRIHPLTKVACALSKGTACAVLA